MLRSIASSRFARVAGARIARMTATACLPSCSFATHAFDNDDNDRHPVLTSLYEHFHPTLDHVSLRDMLRSFVADQVEPQAAHYNQTETFNLDLFRRLGSHDDDGLGLLGLTVPEEYGGVGMDATAVVLVHEELSYADPGFCLAYLAHSLLLVNNLAVNGSHEQKERYLPALCAGTHIGGMGMSEPAAGTDVLGMQTTATPNNSNINNGSNSSDNPSSWTLNGRKMWITNGTVDGTTTGDVFLIYARTGPHRTDISQFIVEKDMPGFILGQQIKDKLGMRASMTAGKWDVPWG